MPAKVVTLRPFEQARETLKEPVDDFVLAGLAHREVNRDVLRVDAKERGVLDGASHVGRLEELLCGNATAVQAGAAHLVALDDGDIETGGSAVEGGGIATRSSANNDDIKLLDLVCHGHSLQ